MLCLLLTAQGQVSTRLQRSAECAPHFICREGTHGWVGALVGLRYLFPYLGYLLPLGNVFSELEKVLRIDPSLRLNAIQKGNWKWGVGEGMALGSERKLLEDPSSSPVV